MVEGGWVGQESGGEVIGGRGMTLLLSLGLTSHVFLYGFLDTRAV